MTARNTLVITSETFRTAVVDGALVARPIRSDRGVVLLAQRAGADGGADEVVVELGPGALEVDGSVVRGTLPGRDGPVPVGAVRFLGEHWKVVLPAGVEAPGTVFDRQIRAFGDAGQRVLGQLRVGVVGAGGTGSALFEQLVRLGVGEIVIIDPDVINDDGSNVTRVYTATMADIGRPKVDLAKRHASEIGLGTKVTPIRGTINDEATARRLTDCDFVFGCTDDNRGRVTLGRLATWYLIPVIDMGVKLTSAGGTLRGIDGRVTVIEPGRGCLQCRGRINDQALHAEVLTADERGTRVAEGYAAELGEPDPAVIAYTTAVASLAVNELFHRLFGLDAEPPSGELVVQFHRRQIRRNSRHGSPAHWCVDPETVGAGDCSPFLGTVWTS